MRQLLILFSLLPLWTQTQVINTGNQPFVNNNNGIQWAENLSWEQIKEKAKKENKYIFVDVFTTWCGPCKLMDKEVYTNDSVGNYFNQHFISVKVQTDKTEKDNEQVRSWYNDAVAIEKKYFVAGYPTFLFLSPTGNLVEKQLGFKRIEDLLTIAQGATKPGKTYDDAFAKYSLYLADYKQGIKKMDRMPFMISHALELRDSNLVRTLLKEYTDYCLTLSSEQRYTRENIEMWNRIPLGSTSKAFQFFYRDGSKIDHVVNKKGYAQAWVCRVIEREMVWAFLKEQSGGNPNMGPGMVVSGLGVKIDAREADWKKLYIKIRKKYNAAYAKRAVLDARIQWYTRNNNKPELIRYQLLKLDKYPPDFTDQDVPPIVNVLTFQIFLQSTDKKLLERAMYWQKKAIDPYPYWSAGLDTYANLLYKAGRKQEAIEWQEKAMNAEKSESGKMEFKKVLEQMKQNQYTYLDMGAVWN